MGKKDIQTSEFFEDNRLFSDLVNGFLFEGKQVLLPENLKEADCELKDTDTRSGRFEVR